MRIQTKSNIYYRKDNKKQQRRKKDVRLLFKRYWNIKKNSKGFDIRPNLRDPPALFIDSKQSYPTQIRFMYYLIMTQTSPKSTLQGLEIVLEISKSNW